MPARLLSDLRAAWRFLWKRPASTTIAILTLGIAVAVTGLASGLLDHAFWRPAGGGDLVTVYNTRPAAPGYQVLSYPDYLAVRDRLDGTVDLAAFVRVESTLNDGGGPRPALAEIVSANYFEVLRAQAWAGRLSWSGDESTGVVISHGVWQRRFGGHADVLGRELRLGTGPYVIVGVAAPGTGDPAYDADVWLPVAAAREVFKLDVVTRRDLPIFQTVGRHTGASLAAVDARLGSLDTAGSADGWRLKALPGEYLRFWPAYRDAVARFLGVFAAIATAILAIAAANLAGLLLARGGERTRELTLRQALGASPSDLLRRVAAEGAILSALGGLLGLKLAAAAGPLLARVPLPVPVSLGVTVDLRLGAWCLLAAAAAGLIFTALSTGWRRGPGAFGPLAAASRTVSARTPGVRALVVVQVALSCALLVAAGLLTRTAWTVGALDPGFDTARQVIGHVTLRDQGYDTATGRRFYASLADALRRAPRIEAVALGWHAPLTRVRATGTYAVTAGPAFQARQNVVSAGYFRTLGIPLLQGREFDERDVETGDPVVIVNDTLADRFGGAAALGQTLHERPGDRGRRIVGIVRAVKYNGLTEGSQPFVYLPFSQVFRPDMYVHVRTTGMADAAVGAIVREEVARLDPNVLLAATGPYATVTDEALRVFREPAIVAAAAGGLAVLLALIGLYGVLATSVERRRREFAIRAALGATPAIIVGAVLREALAMTTAGLALGAILSVWSGRIVADQLFGVDRADPAVLALAPVLVLTASALAWMLPARRAAGVDPATVLRGE